MFSSKHSKLVQTQVCWCWGVCHTKSSEIYFFLEPLLANLELSFALCTNLSPPHLLTFPPDAVQVISISVLGPNLPLLRHVLLCHCWYSSCFHIFCCHLCPLNISNHFSHLAFARLSCIFTRCLSNNNCPSLHLRGLPYIHNLSITPSCLSPLGGHLEPPSRLSLHLSLLLQHLISRCDRSHGTFALWPGFLVSTRSHWHISLFPVFASCPLVLTDPSQAQKCCTQTWGNSTMKGSFYRSAWCVN